MNKTAKELTHKNSERFKKCSMAISVIIFKGIAEKILKEHHNKSKEIMDKYPKGNSQMRDELDVIDKRMSEQLHLEKLLTAWRCGKLNGNGGISRRELRKELIDLLEKHEPANVQKIENGSFQKTRNKLTYPLWKAIDTMQKEPFKDYDIEEILGKCDNAICNTKELIRSSARKEEQCTRDRMEKAGLFVPGVEKRQNTKSAAEEKPNGLRGFLERIKNSSGDRDR